MTKKVITIVFCVLASGCAATYKQPASGPKAILTVPNYNTFIGYELGQVRLAAKGQDGCGQFARVATDGVGPDTVTVEIAAAQEQFIAVLYKRRVMTGLVSCDVVAAFSPDEGKHYSVVFNGRDACQVGIVENSEKQNPKNVRVRKAFYSEWDGIIKVCDAKEKL